MRRDVYVALAALALGYVVGCVFRAPYRWALRTKLRHKLRWLRLVPCLAVAWCSLEVHALGAQATDSIYTMPWVTDTIGVENTGPGAYCVERSADWGSVVIVGKITRFSPDTLSAKSGRLCNGGPVLWDLPRCPAYAPPVGDSPFVLVRCEKRWYRFPSRRPSGPRAGG